jgi:hypothetical protein
LKDRKTSPNTISLDFDIIPMRREEGISIANLEKLLESERFKGVKNKNQLTIPVISPEEVEFFRLQERERYKYLIYVLIDLSSTLIQMELPQ